MSAETYLAIIQKVYADFGKGDIPSVLSALDPEVHWSYYAPSEVPHAGEFHGVQAVIGFFQAVGEKLEILEFGPIDFVASGDLVMVTGAEKVRVKATGKVAYSPWAHAFTFKNNKVIRVREYVDSAAFAAAVRP